MKTLVESKLLLFHKIPQLGQALQSIRRQLRLAINETRRSAACRVIACTLFHHGFTRLTLRGFGHSSTHVPRPPLLPLVELPPSRVACFAALVNHALQCNLRIGPPRAVRMHQRQSITRTTAAVAFGGGGAAACKRRLVQRMQRVVPLLVPLLVPMLHFVQLRPLIKWRQLRRVNIATADTTP